MNLLKRIEKVSENSNDKTRLGLTAPGQLGYALIIEDDPLIALAIEAELHDLGFREFRTAQDEGEALAIAGQDHPAFITVDARLREGSGVDALTGICANRPAPSIVVTGAPFDVSLPGVVTLGKPFSAAAFAAAYEQAVANPFQARAADPA